MHTTSVSALGRIIFKPQYKVTRGLLATNLVVLNLGQETRRHRSPLVPWGPRYSSGYGYELEAGVSRVRVLLPLRNRRVEGTNAR
ncbi:hypothetical protein TNCV_5046011 [Trichonephila clavipes]|uniref:Uncharacterized protein n=1 Tax=Trichonephila clavipes TaxID=2585209 RepID=A0A8X6WHJ8_TRICX|nr:hypothetical protein TNCV_5046011 [Trichonephila clavipes]